MRTHPKHRPPSNVRETAGKLEKDDATHKRQELAQQGNRNRLRQIPIT